MKKLALFISISALLIFAACGSKSDSGAALTSGDSEKVIKTAPLGNLSVTLSSDSGKFKKGDNEFVMIVKDSAGKPVEVHAISLSLRMPAMGTMPEMNGTASFSTTKTPGVCKGKIDIEMAGEWQAKVVYDGPAGPAEASFPVIVQQ